MHNPTWMIFWLIKTQGPDWLEPHRQNPGPTVIRLWWQGDGAPGLQLRTPPPILKIDNKATSFFGGDGVTLKDGPLASPAARLLGITLGTHLS